MPSRITGLFPGSPARWKGAHYVFSDRPAAAGPVTVAWQGGQLGLQERTLLRKRFIDDEVVPWVSPVSGCVPSGSALSRLRQARIARAGYLSLPPRSTGATQPCDIGQGRPQMPSPTRTIVLDDVRSPRPGHARV